MTLTNPDQNPFFTDTSKNSDLFTGADKKSQASPAEAQENHFAGAVQMVQNPQELMDKGVHKMDTLSGDHQRVLVMLYIVREKGPKSSDWLARTMDADICFVGQLLDELLELKLVRPAGLRYRISLGGIAFLELNGVEV